MMAVPTGGGETTADPLVVSGPDQSLTLGLADAAQDVAFVLDQVSVTGCGGTGGRRVGAEIVTVTCDGFAAMLIALEAPVIEGVAASEAVIVCAPAVFNVAEKFPTPFVSVELAGSTAWPSVLVKCTVPE